MPDGGRSTLPTDLSCDWNQLETQADPPASGQARPGVGQNIIDYATGRELPADKLSTPEAKNFRPEPVRRGALRIAKIRHAGDWNVAPLSIPNLTTHPARSSSTVRRGHQPQRDRSPSDPNLIQYPLVYLHGRTDAELQ